MPQFCHRRTSRVTMPMRPLSVQALAWVKNVWPFRHAGFPWGRAAGDTDRPRDPRPGDGARIVPGLAGHTFRVFEVLRDWLKTTCPPSEVVLAMTSMSVWHDCTLFVAGAPAGYVSGAARPTSCSRGRNGPLRSAASGASRRPTCGTDSPSPRSTSQRRARRAARRRSSTMRLMSAIDALRAALDVEVLLRRPKPYPFRP